MARLLLACSKLFSRRSYKRQTETDLEAGDCAVRVTVLVVDVHHHVVVVRVVEVLLLLSKQLGGLSLRQGPSRARVANFVLLYLLLYLLPNCLLLAVVLAGKVAVPEY